MIRLVYESQFPSPPSPEMMADILDTAKRNNDRFDLSGILIATGNRVIQVLEGPEANVLDRFAVISADPRHDHIVEILRTPTRSRMFGDWNMGVVEPQAILEKSSVETVFDVETLASYFAMLGNEPVTEETVALSRAISNFLEANWTPPAEEEWELVS